MLKTKTNKLNSEIAKKSICVNCKFKQNCVLLRDAEKPIHSCNEYECEGKEKDPAIKECTGDSYEKPVYKGLCITCKHKKTCKHADKNTGIWHCENYE